MIDFSTLQALTIPEGVVTKIEKNGVVLWMAQTNKPIILEVSKVTATTYVGSTTREDEEFILLDIYPRRGGTIYVTYDGLTKTIVDDGTSEAPNAQQVFFGHFGGYGDVLETSNRGTLTIEGDCAAFGCGSYSSSSKTTSYCECITEVVNFGIVDSIPGYAFYEHKMLHLSELPDTITSIGRYAFYYCTNVSISVIPEGVKTIGGYAFYMQSSFSGDDVLTAMGEITLPTTLESVGEYAFCGRNNKDGYVSICNKITCLGTVPPVLGTNAFGGRVATIIVPAGCAEAYKAADGWNVYADTIEEASE